MRPLFFDFPEDEGSVVVDDQFMFGPDLLVAPVLETERAPRRELYLPAGTTWTDAWTGEVSGWRAVGSRPMRRWSGFRSTCVETRNCRFDRTGFS